MLPTSSHGLGAPQVRMDRKSQLTPSANGAVPRWAAEQRRQALPLRARTATSLLVACAPLSACRPHALGLSGQLTAIKELGRQLWAARHA